jgi:SAM-dependent methyltransferase
MDSGDRFAYEWTTYDELLPEYEEQFRRWTSAMPRPAWQDKRFLDVGCGMGRNSHWACTHGAAGGVAIDVDERTVAAARRTLQRWPHVQVRQQSAYDIAPDAAFDVVFAIVVIHHLEEPARALRAMAGATVAGGRVLIWVYGQENTGWLVHLLDPVRKGVFSRLPVGVVHALSWLPAAAVWLGLRIGLGRLEYFRLLRRFSFRHVRSIVFDQMLPQIAHYWSEAEVRALMSAAGLVEVRLVWVNEMSWSAVGTKPR